MKRGAYQWQGDVEPSFSDQYRKMIHWDSFSISSGGSSMRK